MDKENLKIILSNNIKHWLASKGLSQVDLANGIGCSETQVSLWISKKYYPSPKFLLKIAQFFKLSVPELTRPPVATVPPPKDQEPNVERYEKAVRHWNRELL